MLWIVISLFLCWLAYREFRSTRAVPLDMPITKAVSKPYVATVLILAAASAWQPISVWRLEHYLSLKATELADGHVARLHCNTIVDTMFDQNLAIGHANPVTGAIVFQYPWCGTLKAYMRHPQRADHDELESLDMLTHESMHVRGEYNEAVTECEAVQRNYRTARMLGVADGVARRNALDFYYGIYETRAYKEDGPPDRYYSEECAPGRALDEHLSDSSWPHRR